MQNNQGTKGWKVVLDGEEVAICKGFPNTLSTNNKKESAAKVKRKSRRNQLLYKVGGIWNG